MLFLPNTVSAQPKSDKNTNQSVCDYIVMHANEGKLAEILIKPSPLPEKDRVLPEEIAEEAGWGNVDFYTIDLNNDGKSESDKELPFHEMM